MDAPLEIETPLMYLDKAATWAMSETLGGETLVELIRETTHSCYRGDRNTRHAWGYGCNDCPACELRSKGYEQWLEENKGTKKKGLHDL
jgi:7-cyano-7-deazaguanine synthase